MDDLDVIGIGAINNDYIFRYKPGRDDPRGDLLDQGPEYLGGVSQEIATRIVRRFRQDSNVTVQVGGSAYLAIKTIAAMKTSLRTGFVGIQGAIDEVEREVSPGFPPKHEFELISDREWLFQSESPPGRALVLIRRSRRVEIRIAQGSNSELIPRIEERLKDSGDPDALARYIASARWVHISSFASFEDFLVILGHVRRAKQLNQRLRCSIDPGYEYVQAYSSRLSEAFEIADIVFLSETEAQHLAGGPDVSERLQIERLGELGSDTRVLIVKSKNRHTLTHQIQNRPVSRKYWHPSLHYMKIRNDTGAGDVFAGGFIAGLLMNELFAHQPIAVRLGAIMAAERLKSEQFPSSAMAAATERFLLRGQRDERLNRRQRWSVLWEAHGPLAVGFLVGMVSSIVATLLLLGFGT